MEIEKQLINFAELVLKWNSAQLYDYGERRSQKFIFNDVERK